MKEKNFEQIKDQLEKELHRIGKQHTKLFRRRVWDLCQELRKVFPQIGHLLYCNGDWWFEVKEYPHETDEQSLCIPLTDGGRERISNFLNLEGEDVVGWEPDFGDIVKELNEIFNYLAYNDFCEVFQLDFNKKLIDNKG